MTDSTFRSMPAYEKLIKLRPLLLKLHKSLLDAEQDSYERVHGPITSKGELFRLVIGDEWFEWLRPISQFIVRIDETTKSKQPVSPNQLHALLAEARDLIPLESADDSETVVRYQRAVQNRPEIAMMHADMMDLLEISQDDRDNSP
ncbi:hypothetical protein PN498_00540 [Oscillatoria sp. CS-180]|uniref:hypothetical protein n=1 Tax=Oscillatoria sp. CS-180 TaxID=3021720 RepID=UPI00232D139C|nr:hypothetical protein [Oscillatoria sp. CS-180]MDB9524459.1 hypothetical protein [Oscillatoria sp. CS-180]